MSRNEFFKLADTALKSSLADAGFKRKGPGLWNRRADDVLSVIRIQSKREGGACCVNLGVHYAFLPELVTNARIPDNAAFREYDCEIRRRLTASNSIADQWWPETEESAAEIGRLALEHALPLFDSYGLSGPIATLSAQAIEDGTPNLLSSMTKGRALLLLARVHEHLSNRDRSIEAATRGIAIVEPHATLVVASLKEVLKRWDHPRS